MGQDRRSQALPAAGRDFVFRLEGEYWTVVFEDLVFRLADSRGLQCLAILLQRPYERIPAFALARGCASREEHDGRYGPVDTAAHERSRVNVTRSVRAALQRIGEHGPPLAAHLDATLHTGALCSYVPDPRTPIAWKVQRSARGPRRSKAANGTEDRGIA
jgi:hypothetical protein